MARTRRRAAAPRPRAWLVPATSLVLAAMPLPGCGHDMVEPDDEPDLRMYGDYTTLPMEQYASVCADIKADCIGKKCGCALADHAVVTGPELMSAEELCLDSARVERMVGVEDGEGVFETTPCCQWKDSNDLGGTRGGCTCKPHWSLPDETCLDGAATYHGCGMASPCDDDGGNVPGQSWCLIDNPELCEPHGINWDYCTPNRITRIGAADVEADSVCAGPEVVLDPAACHALEPDCVWVNSTAIPGLGICADAVNIGACTDDRFQERELCEGAGCMWSGSSCIDGGTCVERPGLTEWGLITWGEDLLERAEASGAASVRHILPMLLVSAALALRL